VAHTVNKEAEGTRSTSQPTSRPRQSREQARARIIEAATDLVRERSFAELKVGELMDRAGLERTIFYRHFENLGDLLLGAGREAIDELYAAQLTLADARVDHDTDSIRQALEVPVAVYRRHGPLLRAVSEALAANQLVAIDQEMIRRRFDELVEVSLRRIEAETGRSFAAISETARALNLLNESYLLDAFGREARVSAETATATLTEIWTSLIDR
jgi:TetR/AcrR family transcriptional regulator, ethionamide resistance regulator